MKRKLSVLIVLGCLSASLLTGCGVSEEAKYVIDMINTIGEVDYDDEVLIGKCEDAYMALTDEQKAEVSNTGTLARAREKMDELLEAKPIPFSYANWNTTQSELIDMMGRNPDDEYDTENGHILQYDNCEYEGYPGLTRYCFVNGILDHVLFITEEYSEDVYGYFDNMYTTKYGNPGFENSAGKVWYLGNANVGIMGVKLFGGYIRLSFNKPVEE